MLIAATEIVTSSLPLLGAEIVGGLFIFYGLARYLKYSNVKSQLEAKDAIIETNQQTIESIEDRLKAIGVKINTDDKKA